MKKVIFQKKECNKFKNGYPLIQLKDLHNEKDQLLTKEWLQFYSPSKEYIGTGYIGVQNKGIGWIVSSNQGEKINKAFFVSLFQKAIAVRNSFFYDETTTAFRIFNGEGDGLGGVTIDWYDGYGLFSWYNESIYELKELIVSGFKEAIGEVKGLYEKNRFDNKDLPESQHIWGAEATEPLLVKENGVTFATYLNEGMMTGIFLDQKEIRGKLVDGMAIGMNVLNTFSYTGAFSVAAAMGGAASTVSVDLAKRSLPKTQEMFAENGLSLESNKIVVMDVFEYFRYAKRKSLLFDMIILDPPSFARNKKQTFSVAQNYGDLVEDVAELIAKNGVLIASTNAANVTFDKYKMMVEQGLKKQKRQFKLLEKHQLPADFNVNPNFKEGNYLKILIYQVM